MQRSLLWSEDTLEVDPYVFWGGASYHLSKELKGKYPEIEWRKIKGMRHVLVHDYYRINSELLWNTKEQKLFELRDLLEEVISREG